MFSFLFSCIPFTNCCTVPEEDDDASQEDTSSSIQQAIDDYTTSSTKKYQAFYHILEVIEQKNCFPVTLSISPTEMLTKLKNYRNVILEKLQVDIAKFHVFFGNSPLSIKMEMMTFCGQWCPFTVDENGMSQVHHAVRCRELKLLQLLLEKGADVNLKDSFGNTPIFYTCSKKHKDGETVAILLSFNADPNLTNKQGDTFYAKAQTKRNFNNLKKLL